MIHCARAQKGEPIIAVGLVQDAKAIRFKLEDVFREASGLYIPAGDYEAKCENDEILIKGPVTEKFQSPVLTPLNPNQGTFSIEATIGIDFHWQQREIQTFQGGLRFLVGTNGQVTAVNDIELEKYILSVICSEMSAESPFELAKAHSIISRSWLLAQLEPSLSQPPNAENNSLSNGEISRYYDREAHTRFDVCADDHCQRYQGTGRISTGIVHDAIKATRGMVLVHSDRVCDARFSKCCGGVTEDFRVAWSETEVPYLVPVLDGKGRLPNPALSEDEALRRFISGSPAVYCNCSDDAILSRVLNSYDRDTRDFFRWQIRLDAIEAGELINRKTGIDLGRIISIEPVERGLSGRLKRLRIKGEKASIVIGKELEIRKALSSNHLYSSAFVVDTEGPTSKPEAFVLTGAGWGHGVGLCQIGAAVMASEGVSHDKILTHYYPAATTLRLYD